MGYLFIQRNLSLSLTIDFERNVKIRNPLEIIAVYEITIKNPYTGLEEKFASKEAFGWIIKL